MGWSGPYCYRPDGLTSAPLKKTALRGLRRLFKDRPRWDRVRWGHLSDLVRVLVSKFAVLNMTDR